MINNLPNDPSFTISGLPFAPATPGNAGAAAAAGATAFTTGFNNGATFSGLNAAVPAATGSPFSVPNFFNAATGYPSTEIPGVEPASREGLRQQHGVDPQICGKPRDLGNDQQYRSKRLLRSDGSRHRPGGNSRLLLGLGITAFTGLPALPIDPRFLTVTEISSGYNSNYNGLTASFLRRFSSFQFQFNYTWSHALDFVSNSGQARTPFNFITNVSITNPQNPFNVRQNMYGNADYDIRHYFSANYVYTTPKSLLSNKWGRWLGDWTIAGTIFAHTGLRSLQ